MKKIEFKIEEGRENGIVIGETVATFDNGKYKGEVVITLNGWYVLRINGKKFALSPSEFASSVVNNVFENQIKSITNGKNKFSDWLEDIGFYRYEEGKSWLHNDGYEVVTNYRGKEFTFAFGDGGVRYFKTQTELKNFITNLLELGEK